MLDYVYGQDELVAQFVAQLIPHVRGYGFARAKAIGVIDADGRLVGGIVYHDYNPQSGVIMLAAAATSPRWLTRETLRRMYEYPFSQLGVQMVAQPTPADNERLLRQLAALDYMFVLVPRMFGRERDGVLALFTREAWQKSKFIRRPELRLEEAA